MAQKLPHLVLQCFLYTKATIMQPVGFCKEMFVSDWPWTWLLKWLGLYKELTIGSLISVFWLAIWGQASCNQIEYYCEIWRTKIMWMNVIRLEYPCKGLRGQLIQPLGMLFMYLVSRSAAKCWKSLTWKGVRAHPLDK